MGHKFNMLFSFYFLTGLTGFFRIFLFVNFQMKLTNPNQPAAEKIYVKIMKILSEKKCSKPFMCFRAGPATEGGLLAS
jgi:hypothetical protein